MKNSNGIARFEAAVLFLILLRGDIFIPRQLYHCQFWLIRILQRRRYSAHTWM